MIQALNLLMWYSRKERPMPDESFLVSFDTDRIKEYVFATDKLREIRGASYLLTQLNESQTEV